MYPNMQPITLVPISSFIPQTAEHVLVERHLEKTPIGYIQWRFQDGHDRPYFLVPDDFESDLL
jgi:hypothetical protein